MIYFNEIRMFRYETIEWRRFTPIFMKIKTWHVEKWPWQTEKMNGKKAR